MTRGRATYPEVILKMCGIYDRRERIIHHNDCTYCKQRHLLGLTEDGRSADELCKLTHNRVPGERYCEYYQQERCPCEKCNS